MEKADNTKKYECFAHNLYRFGFPMTHNGTNTANIKIEELIIRILAEIPDPRFILGIPVIMHKNKIDIDKIYKLSIKYDVINPVGWILEEAYNTYNRCANIERKEIKNLINLLEPLKKEEEQIISVEKYDGWFRKYAKKRQTNSAKKWHILSGFTEDGFDYEFKRRCLISLQEALEELIKKN